MEREELLSVLELASAALAKENETILPILAGFKFEKGRVITYDDVISVSIPLDIGLQGVLPGHQLLRFLNSCGTKDVGVSSKDSTVTIKCDRAKLSLPSTDVKDWPFKKPKTEGTFKVELNAAFFRGLGLCTAVVPDKGLSSWMGGISFYFGKTLRLYALNATRDGICHFTIPELGTGGKVERYIVPVSFCKTALTMAKKCGQEGCTLYVNPSSLLITFPGDAILYGKLIEAEGQNIAGRVKTIMDEIDGEFCPITPELADGIKRSSILGGNDGACNVVIDDKIRLRTSGPGNVSLAEPVPLKGKHPEVEVNIAAPTLLKMLGECQEIRFLQHSTVARADDSFVYIVANRG